MYFFRCTHGPADLAFTDRFGGVSAAPFDELNLAISGSDDPVDRAENHRLLMADFAPEARLAGLRQVHGSAVVDADPGVQPEADGIVTTDPGVVLIVRVADCVPVLFASPTVVGAAHAGRAGMASGVAAATVARMRDLGAAQIHAWIGPSICGGCYEVPAAMRDQVAAIEPASASTTTWGTPALDVAAGVKAQLEREEVTVIESGWGCTREHDGLFSYRRDAASSGRHAGVIQLREAARV